MGPRFFIPQFFLPKKFNYFINLNEPISDIENQKINEENDEV